MDALDRLDPPLRIGERVSLRAGSREVIGFVTQVDSALLEVLDRRGIEHAIPRGEVVGVRRVGVALGRDPLAAPRALLDALAARAGAAGEPWVIRISALLDGRTPPASVPAWGAWAEVEGVRARFEGEWVTLADAGVDAAVAAAWWATRMGARSVQVRTSDAGLAAALGAAGFGRR